MKIKSTYEAKVQLNAFNSQIQVMQATLNQVQENINILNQDLPNEIAYVEIDYASY